MKHAFILFVIIMLLIMTACSTPQSDTVMLKGTPTRFIHHTPVLTRQPTRTLTPTPRVTPTKVGDRQAG